MPCSLTNLSCASWSRSNEKPTIASPFSPYSFCSLMKPGISFRHGFSSFSRLHVLIRLRTNRRVPDIRELGAEGLQHLFRMLRRVGDLLPVLLHRPVRADPDTGPDDADGLLPVHHLLPVGTPLLHQLPIRVAQERERKLVLLDEVPMRLSV